MRRSATVREAAAPVVITMIVSSPAIVPTTPRTLVWSMAEAPELEAALREVFAAVKALPHEVRLQERDERYWLYVARVASEA